MNVNSPEAEPKTSVTTSKGDSAKLLSLLALAGGAVAMPQTSNADIVFVDLSTSPVHVGPQTSSSYIINTLPGTAQLGFHTHILPNSVGGLSSSRFITGRQQAGYVRFKTQASFIVMANRNQTWNQIGGIVASIPIGSVGQANYNTAFPGNYTDKYLLFRFQDSTQPGNPLRYGWVELSLADSRAEPGQPDMTITGYAYDTSGGFIGGGQVPEPSAAALLALGALTLGAKGLRSWRKNRPAGTRP